MPIPDFHTFPSTLVAEVLDMVCRACVIENATEFAKLCRLVCCGCAETVEIYPPAKAKAGFVFEGGKAYHVPNCPVCEPQVKSSKIVEMVLFYKRNGIPYE